MRIIKLASLLIPQLLWSHFPKSKPNQMSKESMCSCFQLASQGTDFGHLWSLVREFPHDRHRAHDFVLSSGTSSHSDASSFAHYSFPAHSLSVLVFLSQTHGPGGPEELHLLAEGERRRHRVCRARLCHVQSTAETAVIRQHDTDTSSPSPLGTSVDSAPALLTPRDSKTGQPTNQPTRPIASDPYTTSSSLHNARNK